MNNDMHYSSILGQSIADQHRKLTDPHTTSELFRITKNNIGQFRLERATVYNGVAAGQTNFTYFSGPFSTLKIAKEAKIKAEMTSPYNVWTVVNESEE